MDEKSIGGREGNGPEMSVGEDRVLTASVRLQVLTAASMKFRIVFWDVVPCKIIVD
jgi:hypothetical protein